MNKILKKGLHVMFEKLVEPENDLFPFTVQVGVSTIIDISDETIKLENKIEVKKYAVRKYYNGNEMVEYPGYNMEKLCKDFSESNNVR